MKWKKRTAKIVLITFSIISSYLATAPNVAVSAEQLETKKLAGIESVVSIGDGPATELVIKLTSPATYTSYKTASPLRLVIDFSQVSQGSISSPVIINKGNFKTVTASRFDTDAGVLTRVEIALVNDSEAIITTHPASPGELKVSFPVEEETVPSAASGSPVEKPAVAAEPPSSVQELASAPVSEAPFRTLTAITVKNNTITLALDGAISDFKTFRLNKPERYVVDLINVKSGLSSRLLPLNASGVASARVGLYPDKVRVVLDAVNGTFPEATSVKTDTGVVITLDVKPADENVAVRMSSAPEEKTAEEKAVTRSKTDVTPAAPAEVKPVVASVAAPEVKPEAAKQAVPDKQTPKAANKSKQQIGAAVIEMIDFQVVNGLSRVSVKVTGDYTAEQPVKTPGFVTLSIKNSILPKKLQRSLETRSFVSPVLRITPLTVKTKKSTETKIRIAIRVPASFEYRQEGDMIY
ncbi:MAG: AMIN domain-containing protein, partial [Chlorobiales bacterium]|nr:AMIN domain-containing protein [Chlorobiales bacterium]